MGEPQAARASPRVPLHPAVAPLTPTLRAPIPIPFRWGPGGCSEMEQHEVIDLGLSPAELGAISDAYAANMAEVNAYLIARGAFTEQLFFRGVPFINDNTTCASTLRPLCSGKLPDAYSRFSFFDLNTWPGNGGINTNVSVAEFLLGRGPYAAIGVLWSGCGCGCGVPEWPPILDLDFGEPVDATCSETAPGVFSRRWSRADVSIDCNTPGQATPHIDMHH